MESTRPRRSPSPEASALARSNSAQDPSQPRAARSGGADSRTALEGARGRDIDKVSQFLKASGRDSSAAGCFTLNQGRLTVGMYADLPDPRGLLAPYTREVVGTTVSHGGDVLARTLGSAMSSASDAAWKSAPGQALWFAWCAAASPFRAVAAAISLVQGWLHRAPANGETSQVAR